MNDARNNILEAILDEIGYTEDRKSFIDKFEKNLRIETLLNLAERLPKAEKNKIDELSPDPEKRPLELAKMLKSYYTEKEIETEITEVANRAIRELIVKLQPTLPEEKRRSLVQIPSRTL